MGKIIQFILAIIRLYLVVKIVYILFVNYDNFQKINTGEFLWYSLFLLMDIWLVNITRQMIDFNNQEED
jgi:hypothetical protein